MLYFSISVFHLRVIRLINVFTFKLTFVEKFISDTCLYTNVYLSFPEPYPACVCTIYYITVEVNRFYLKY